MRRVLLLLLVSSAAWAQEAKDFEKGLRRAEALDQRRKWKAGKKHLTALLQAHENQNYVRARRADVERLMKSFAFRLAHGFPDPKKLVSGELLHWNPTTGAVKVRYTNKTMGDFQTRGAFRMHNSAFSGPHAITVKGPRYPRSGTGPQFVVCERGEEYMLVIPGMPERREGNEIRWMSPQVLYFVGKDERTAGQKNKTLCVPGKKFRLRVQINKGSVVASYNNRTVVKGRKRAGLWGFVGFSKDLRFDEVLIDGITEKAWIEGLIDKQDGERRKAFERSYHASDHLPAWLYELGDLAEDLTEPDDRTWPGPMSPAEARLANVVVQRIEQARYDQALAVLDDGEASVAVREFLRALVYEAAGKPQEALAACKKVCQADEEFVPAFEMQARLLVDLRQADAAVEVYHALLARYPGGDRLHVGRAMLLHRLGRSTEACKLLEQTIAGGLSSGLLDGTLATLVKATRGPPWSRRYEYKSKHYHVVTDIDKKICYEAARLLEESYTAYIVRLERVADAEKRRFRVYLFSGEQGYTNYCKDSFGYALSQSAGCYDPELKQLLIWNAPTRDFMMRTIRHEGFHQYLDRIMENPPAWFNEGLAEYYETATVVRGKWRLGVDRPDHRRVLAKKGLIPLSVFLFEDHEKFMADADRHYAQAWALIRFLRHGTKEDQELFDRLWQAFKTRRSNKAAIHWALGPRNLAALQTRFSAAFAKKG